MAQWVRQWQSQTWVDQVDAWLERALDAYGVRRTGPLTRHGISLSAAVFTTLTEAGPVYLKAPAPGRRIEAELVALIAPRSEGHVVMPLAVEPDEGLLLSPAAGQSVAERNRAARRRGEDPLDLTPRVMADAAQTQLALAGMGDDLAQAGLIAGLLPSELRFHAEVALQRHTSLPEDHPLALPDADAEVLEKGLPRLDDAAAALTSVSIPETLVPGTLGPSEILLPSSRRAPVTFLGWGAARWSHPFGWVAIAVEQAAEHGGADLSESVETYLRAFSDWGSPEELGELLPAAGLLATVQRHEAVMDLLLGAEAEDQVAGAPEAFRLLERMLLGPRTAGSHRH